MISAAMCLGGRDLSEPLPSPDGSAVLVGVRSGGRSGFVLVPLAGGPERTVACDPAPALGRGLGGGGAAWLGDSSGFVYAATDGEVWEHRLDGRRRPLTALGGGRSVTSPTLSRDGRRLAYVVDLAEVHVLDLHGGDDRVAQDRVRDDRVVEDRVVEDRVVEDRVVSAGSDFVVDPSWHPDGVRLVWSAWSVPDMSWDRSVVAAPGGVVVSAPGLQVHQARFGPDGRLWTVRDTSGWLNVWCEEDHVVAEPFEHAGPTWGPGQRSYAVAPDGHHVVFHRNEGGFGRLCVADTRTGDVREVAKGVHGQLSWQGTTVVALRTGARTPTQVVAYDTRTWERRVLAVGPCAEWDHVDLAEPQSVSCPGQDGTSIPARLYRPTGTGAARGLVCWIHGGPTDQWLVSFLPRVAYWASRGWTVLVPDHRGSTGHGRAFQQAMHGRWGELDVADVVAAVRHAHAEGWGTADRTVLMGGSAGGFTALNVAVHHPELVAAAALAYPVTDLAALDDATDRFEAHYHATLVGPRPGGDTAAQERYRHRSPLTHASRLRCPLLVLHGDADPVVPVAQSIALADRVRAAGGHVELHVYEGEGHGFRQPATQADEFARIGDFLDRVLPPA